MLRGSPNRAVPCGWPRSLHSQAGLAALLAARYAHHVVCQRALPVHRHPSLAQHEANKQAGTRTWHFKPTPPMSTYLGAPRCYFFVVMQLGACSQPAPPPPCLLPSLLLSLHTGRLCFYHNTLSHTLANIWPALQTQTRPVSPCAVCVIVGEFASTSQLVKAGASGSVNVSVWGTPDRRATL